MRLIGLAVVLTLSVILAPLAGEGQQTSRVSRIGFLSTDPPPAYVWEALLDGLRERGYIEGQNLVFERRFSEGNVERRVRLIWTEPT
jgi:putative tryptophan/tyrosine transport system substrate-binding protein